MRMRHESGSEEFVRAERLGRSVWNWTTHD